MKNPNEPKPSAYDLSIRRHIPRSYRGVLNNSNNAYELSFDPKKKHPKK